MSEEVKLSIAAASKQPSVRNMFDTLNETFFFLLYTSPKRQYFLENVLDLDVLNENKKKLTQLCHTRWVEHSMNSTLTLLTL